MTLARALARFASSALVLVAIGAATASATVVDPVALLTMESTQDGRNVEGPGSPMTRAFSLDPVSDGAVIMLVLPDYLGVGIPDIELILQTNHGGSDAVGFHLWSAKGHVVYEGAHDGRLLLDVADLNGDGVVEAFLEAKAMVINRTNVYPGAVASSSSVTRQVVQSVNVPPGRLHGQLTLTQEDRIAIFESAALANWTRVRTSTELFATKGDLLGLTHISTTVVEERQFAALPFDVEIRDSNAEVNIDYFVFGREPPFASNQVAVPGDDPRVDVVDGGSFPIVLVSGVDENRLRVAGQNEPVRGPLHVAAVNPWEPGVLWARDFGGAPFQEPFATVSMTPVQDSLGLEAAAVVGTVSFIGRSVDSAPAIGESEWLVMDAASGREVRRFVWPDVTRLPAGVGGGVGAVQDGVLALSVAANVSSLLEDEGRSVQLEWVDDDGSLGWSRALPASTLAVADPGANGAVDLDGDLIGDVVVVTASGPLAAVWMAVSGATGEVLWEREVAGPWVHAEVIPAGAGTDLLFVSPTPTGDGDALGSLSFGVEPIHVERVNGTSGVSVWQAIVDPNVAVPNSGPAAFIDVFVHSGSAPGADPIAVSFNPRTGGTTIDSALREHQVGAFSGNRSSASLAALFDAETGAPLAWGTTDGVFFVKETTGEKLPFITSSPGPGESNATPAMWPLPLLAALLLATAIRRASGRF